MDLTYFARKYIWRQPSEASLSEPRRIIAQVVNLGTFEEVGALRALVGETGFAQALRQANPGGFSERSWHFWHLTLDLAALHQIPPLPVRRFRRANCRANG